MGELSGEPDENTILSNERALETIRRIRLQLGVITDAAVEEIGQLEDDDPGNIANPVEQLDRARRAARLEGFLTAVDSIKQTLDDE